MVPAFPGRRGHNIEVATLERVGSLQESYKRIVQGALFYSEAMRLVWSLVGCRTDRKGIVIGDVSTVDEVLCEGPIGRFPRSEGFRSLSKLPRRKPIRRCNPRRKSRPEGEMAEFRNSRRFD